MRYLEDWIIPEGSNEVVPWAYFPTCSLLSLKKDKIAACSNDINEKQAFLEEGSDVGYMLVGPASTCTMFRRASYVIKLQKAPLKQFKCRWNLLL